MSKKRLYPLVVEVQGILATAAAVRHAGKTWIWLRGDQALRLLESCHKDYLYQLQDPELSTIETRYPRHLLGYAETACGRFRRGGFTNSAEDVMVDAKALWNLIRDTKDRWRDTIGFDLVAQLVELAASIGEKKEAPHGGA